MKLYTKSQEGWADALAYKPKTIAQPTIEVYASPVDNTISNNTHESKSRSVFGTIKSFVKLIIDKEISLLGKRTQKND